MIEILSAIGGWGLLVLLAVINGFIAWKVLSKNLFWSIVFIIGVVGVFVLTVVTEPNCGCLSEYTDFRRITKTIVDTLDKVFWFVGNYFLIVMAVIAFFYFIKGRHPMASRFFWETVFNFVLLVIWWRLNYVYVKCLSCPLICDMEISWEIIEECMVRHFW